MEWSGKKDFGSSAEKPFMVDGKEAGVLKSYGPLSFLKVSSGICKLKRVLPYQQSFNQHFNIDTSACIHKYSVYKTEREHLW
jgi:hypothetical protein